MHDMTTIKGRQLLKKNTPQTRLSLAHTENCRVLPSREAMLERLPRHGTAAEIGVAYGRFTDRIVRINAPRKLHLIDAWGDKRFEPGLAQVQERFAEQINNGSIIINRGYSTDELARFDDGYFDWVYIDTNHSFGTTYKELMLSAAKVRQGGLIAGHDFCTGNVIDPVPYGVIEACAKFCVEEGWEHRFLALEANGHFSFCLGRI